MLRNSFMCSTVFVEHFKLLFNRFLLKQLSLKILKNETLYSENIGKNKFAKVY